MSKTVFSKGRERGIREAINFVIRYADMPTVANDMERFLLPTNTAHKKLGEPKYGWTIKRVSNA